MLRTLGCFIQLIIDVSGQVRNVEIAKGEVSDPIDRQVVAIVSSMTKWSRLINMGSLLRAES
jgi:hypothetical protein